MYGVYSGSVAGGGGRIVIFPMPAGGVLMGGARVEIPCADGSRTRTGFYHYKPYFRATYTDNTITYSAATFAFEATLTDPNTLSGTTWTADRVINEGGPICQPGKISFTATFKGVGKDILAREVIDTLSLLYGTSSPASVIQNFELYCGCKLP
jgi:hypothetical protein